MFSKRDPTVWMPALGSFSYALPSPKAKPERFVGVVRGPIPSAEQAISIFARVDQAAQQIARKRGLVSHEIFIKIGAPGEALRHAPGTGGSEPGA
jgi:hypothetical protein